MQVDERTLQAEKIRLEKEFKGYAEKINKVESDLGQMKANLNALNGAIQQTDKLIAMLDQDLVADPNSRVKDGSKNVAAATIVK